VTVAADDEAAGLRQAELGRHHVHDALTVGIDVIEADAGGGGLRPQALEQRRCGRVGLIIATRHGRYAMVGGRGRELRVAHTVALLAQLLQALHGVEIVQQVAVDVEQGKPVAEIGDDVRIPDLVEQGCGR